MNASAAPNKLSLRIIARLPLHRRPARSGNALAKPSRVAGSTPRSVISPVTSRAGVTSKP